jgi:phosphatidylglycerophosphatase A
LPDTPIIRPTAGFMLSHPAHVLSFGFGTGLSPFVPGTVGTLLAIPLYWALAQVLSPAGILALTPVLFLVGVWATGRTGRALGVSDHSGMNWDEIVAMLAILAFTPPTVAWQALAFFAFRFFDVVKPPPVRTVDARLKGGLGVMLDDVLAAGYTLLVIAIVKSVVDR